MPVSLRHPLSWAFVLILAACAAPPPGPASIKHEAPPVAAEPLPEAPLPAVAALAADPSLFKGIEGRAVLARLGDPNFRRRDPPAEVWQYYGDKCVLDLFLYDEDGTQRVAHAEIRSRTAGEGNGCLLRLLSGRVPPS